MPALIGLQIAPIQHDHRMPAAQQPPCYGRVQLLIVRVQMSITQQSIKRLQECTDALCIWPCARDIDQGQTTALNQRLNGTQQHPAGAVRASAEMHRPSTLAILWSRAWCDLLWLRNP